ncbi:hypothetical protein HaLaN_32119, partial [Haematococcus lacustris]
PGQAGDWS